MPQNAISQLMFCESSYKENGEHPWYRNIATTAITTARVTRTLQEFTQMYLKWNTNYFLHIISNN